MEKLKENKIKDEIKAENTVTNFYKIFNGKIVPA
jgi:hypothetical protein